MESEKISKPKLLWDGIKHIACAVWGEYTPVRRKEIKATELMGIFEMLSPSFSHFTDRLRWRGIKIDSEDERRLSDLFNTIFVSLFPKEIENEKINNLFREFQHILKKAGRPHALVIEDLAFVSHMFLSAESILSVIKENGLEKHIFFYERPDFFTSKETFWGAVIQFLNERLQHETPILQRHSRTLGPKYMSKWSFIFNREIVRASSNIEIKNLKVTGNFYINLERFTRVVFSRNVFSERVDMRVGRHEQLPNKNEFIFYRNFFRSFNISFKRLGLLIFDRNNFKDYSEFRYSLMDTKDPKYKHNNASPSIRLINNKSGRMLTIYGGRPTGYLAPIFVPIKMEFLRKNRLTELEIHTGDIDLGGEKGKSDIEYISFDVHEEIKPIRTDPILLMEYKMFFLELKNQAIEKRDKAAEFNYARKERYFDWRLSSRWQDRFVFGWSAVVSDSGISWVRPLAILLCLQVICIGLPVWCMTEDCELGIMLAIETLNPLTTLSAGLSKDLLSKHPYLIPTLTLFQKIYLSILLYEIIKVLRRFSK